MTERKHLQNPSSGRSENDEDISAALAGKYMTFKLAGEEYGVGILCVKEIIKLMGITHVPRTKEFIRGVINLRGKVIPVMDLRLKFGMGRTETTDHTVIVIVQYLAQEREIVMGILVDEVLEVMNFKAEQLEPPPHFGGDKSDSHFLLGIGKRDNRVIFLLDMEKVLMEEEMIVM